MTHTSVLQVMIDIRNLLLLNKDTLSLDEAATYAGLEKSYLYKLCSKKEIRHFKSKGGKTTYFDKKDLDDWMKAIEVKTNNQISEELKNIKNPFKSKGNENRK